jgi:hypothetical protein
MSDLSKLSKVHLDLTRLSQGEQVAGTMRFPVLPKAAPASVKRPAPDTEAGSGQAKGNSSAQKLLHRLRNMSFSPQTLSRQVPLLVCLAALFRMKKMSSNTVLKASTKKATSLICCSPWQPESFSGSSSRVKNMRCSRMIRSNPMCSFSGLKMQLVPLLQRVTPAKP